MSLALDSKLLNFGKAIGLLKANGELDPSWFGSPITYLESILKLPSQRAAFLDLIDDLIPGAPIAGSQPNEEWHPLLGEVQRGNAYLTVRAVGDHVVFGAAADFRTAALAAPPPATLNCQLPLVSFHNDQLTAIAGTADGPLTIRLRVALDWTTPAEAISLRAIRMELRLIQEPLEPNFQFEIVLEGLDLDETGARDTLLDPANLDSQAVELILGLLGERLRQVAVGAVGEAAAVAAHLMPLFGFEPAMPVFPFADLLNGPGALQSWLNALIAGGHMTTWVGHLAGLFGAAAPAASGQGTVSNPWTARVIDLAVGGSGLDLTLAVVDGKLRVGVRAVLVPNAPNPSVRVEADAMLVGIPLSGTGSADVLPSAAILLRAPANAAPLVPNNGTIGVEALRAGAVWNGASLTAVLELLDVEFGGVHYAVLDLTSADSVVAAATAGVRAAVLAAIGNAGPGPHLAALAGLSAPAGDAEWPFFVDPNQLLTNPSRAIAAVHRDALLDSAHHWGVLLGEVGALIGLLGPVSGTGTIVDPWRLTLATASPVDVELVAWNAQDSGNSADPQLLRLGLRLSADGTPWSAWWVAELLAFDLPEVGAGDVRLMAGQHAAFLFQPNFSTPPFDGSTIGFSSFGATLDWEPGGTLVARGVLNDLTVTSDGHTVTLPSLAFPDGVAFDVSNPVVSLGIDTNQLRSLVAILVARGAYGWAGMPGLVTTGLFGIHDKLPGLPSDWPTLGATAFTDPLGALREWLHQTAAGGKPHLLEGLAWLRALLGNELNGLTPVAPAVDGDGVYASPWRIPMGSAQLRVWLEPDGPPASWVAGVQTAIAGATRYADLLEAARSLGSNVPALRKAMAFISIDEAGAALGDLEDYIDAGDGVVPLDSQVPIGGTWTSGTLLACGHPNEPADPSAIQQILAQLDAWNPVQRAVLLLGPAFSDHTAWTALRSEAEAQRAGSTNDSARFDLRVPNTDPLTVDLNPITTVSDYYTADLQDDGVGSLDSLIGQIGRIVARIRELRPGLKVNLVAHSTAGTAARAFTATNPALVQGLITLGTPHMGASLLPLRDTGQAGALRVLQWVGSDLPAGALGDAVEHLILALDGYEPPVGSGELPKLRPYPIGSFTSPGGTETGGVPAFAIGSKLPVKLFEGFKAAIAASAAGAADGAPTHLGIGLEGPLAIPAPSAGQLSVDATICADVGRIALQPGIPDLAGPDHSVTFSAKIRRPGGWLTGMPHAFAGDGAALSDVRVRWAEIGATLVRSGSSIAVTPFARLHDAAFHGDTRALVELDNSEAEPLIGEVLRVLSGHEATAGSPASALLDALGALGLTVPDPSGGIGLSTDALSAIQVDARGYLAARLSAALDKPGGLLGLSGPPGGPWTLPLGTGPLDVYVANSTEWTVGLRTRADSALPLSGSLSATFAAQLAVPSLAGALDIGVKLGGVELNYSDASGQLTLVAPPYVNELVLLPAPAPATLTSAINQALPRILLSSAVAALLEATFGPQFKVGAIDRLLGSPGQTLGGSGSLGGSGGLDALRINQLLRVIATALGPPPTTPGLDLPGDLRVIASGAGTVTLRLETTAPIGGVLSFQLDSQIDPMRHVTPAGSLTLALPLPGTWGNVDITFRNSPTGVSLVVQPNGSNPIRLLPTFSGLGALAGVAQSLLPVVLDEMVNSFAPAPPKLVELSLDLAKAFDLADAAGSFQARAAKWKAVQQADWLGAFINPAVRNDIATAFTNLFNDVASPLNGQIPGTFSNAGGMVNWSMTPPGATGTLALALGWDSGGPALTVAANNLQAANGPLRLSLQGGRASGTIQAEASIGFSLESSVGVTADPEFSFSSTGSGFAAHFLPLGAGTASALDIRLLPTPGVDIGAGAPLEFVKKWLLPITADLLIDAARPKLGEELWFGGPRLRKLLETTGIIQTGQDTLAPGFPDFQKMVTGLLTELVTTVDTPITPTLSIRFVNEIPRAATTARLGVRLVGHQEFPAGDLRFTMLFGGPAIRISDPMTGVTLYLFDADTLALQPLLQVSGLGVGFAGKSDAPLINTNLLRLGAFLGYLFFDVNLGGSVSVSQFGAGVELEQFGLPLGQALSGNSGGDNPVAASLLQSDGTGGGDPNPVNPTVSVTAAYRPNDFIFKIDDQEGAFWIGVRRSFGPMYIEQIGLEMREANSELALLVDGGVKVDGLEVGVDDLTVVIPLKQLATPAEWTLDLRGLAVGFQQTGLSIAGGLVKNPGPPASYDGMLQVDIAGKGVTAVGSYARPSDELGEYTSLFIFASIPISLGGPPAFFVLGLGGGAGYNRQLKMPTDLNAIPNFLLVRAIDNPTFANDPMRALREMATSIPPKRGSFWLAAGLKVNSFVFVNTTAVLYVAVDRGFEIGILGVSRMALPSADFAIANIELALKARFNSAEGILSIQAQLTDNSYILHPSCQLTGGFAFFIWFPEGQFLLTLGGYHPAFQTRPEYPDVPRLGFRWIMGPVTIKGESYFALTNSCVMAGGRLEAVFKAGPIRAWFIAWADLLVSWDPFAYDISIGVEIGVRVEFRVCFLGCVTIRIGLTLGASVHIIGPPMYAVVTIDAYITTVTITFGDPPPEEPDYITDFNFFKGKYLTTGDAEEKAVGVRVTQGMIAPEPPGAQPAPGTQEQPWRVVSEFVFVTETRMPAHITQEFVTDVSVIDPDSSEVDLAPMNKKNVDSTHRVQIFRASDGLPPELKAKYWDISTIIGLFPEATWNFTEPKQQRAASETIPAVSGMKIVGCAVMEGQSELIQITGMVDDLPKRAKPLPFATNTAALTTKLVGFGTSADTLLGDLSELSTEKMIAGAEKVLSAGGPMAERRVAAGLPPGGISPLARRSLRHERSAPPLIAPLTTGLTMEPVGLAPPPAVLRVQDVARVYVERPVLKAVLQARPLPVSDAPPALHTSVSISTESAAIRRMVPAKPQVMPGALLQPIPARRAPRFTDAAYAARTVHNPDMGVLAGPAHRELFERADCQLASEGVKIPAGATHIWELPPHDERMSFEVAGRSAIRTVFLDRAGRAIFDCEYRIARRRTVPIPAEAFSFAITCLGHTPQRSNLAPGFAALSFRAARPGAYATAGWQIEGLGDQVAPSTILVQGASLVLPSASTTMHRNQATILGKVSIAHVLRSKRGAETWLPASATVVMVILDGQNPTAAADGDLKIALEDVILATPPIPVGGGRRRALLYDVIQGPTENDYFRVSVGSSKGWRLAGVAGLKGRAIEWANRFHGEVPERIVSEGPLSPTGAVVLRLVKAKSSSRRRRCRKS